MKCAIINDDVEFVIIDRRCRRFRWFGGFALCLSQGCMHIKIFF